VSVSDCEFTYNKAWSVSETESCDPLFGEECVYVGGNGAGIAETFLVATSTVRVYVDTTDNRCNLSHCPLSSLLL